MASELLSSVTGGSGGTAYPFPAMPTPLTNDGYNSLVANRIPHNGTLVDNVQIATAFVTTALGDYVGLLAEVAVWTVNATDVNAACDGWAGIQSPWYDSVNDRLYVFAVDSGTTPDTIYTAYITVETGAVTNVGNAQLTTDPISIGAMGRCSVGRSAIDSGNFTLKFNDRTAVINETTGAEISNIAETNVNASLGVVGTYTSLDGFMQFNTTLETSSEGGNFTFSVSGVSYRVPSPVPILSAVFAGSTAAAWGDKIKILGGANTATTGGFIRSFTRSEFDLWLRDIAKLGGLV